MATQKTALVTGSSSGIGLGIAVDLAANGYHVIMTGSRSESDAANAIGKVKRYFISFWHRGERYECKYRNKGF